MFLKNLKSPKLPLYEAEEKLLEAVSTVLTLKEKLYKKSTNTTNPKQTTPPLSFESKADFSAKYG